jgi:hypothetical protein
MEPARNADYSLQLITSCSWRVSYIATSVVATSSSFAPAMALQHAVYLVISSTPENTTSMALKEIQRWYFHPQRPSSYH